MNSKKSRADHGRLTPKNVILEPPLLRIFPKTHLSTRNEMLGEVTDLGNPNLNIERAALENSPGGWEWGGGFLSPPRQE